MSNERLIIIVVFFFLVPFSISGQSISAFIPDRANPAEKYLFYLHGGVVQQQGAHAVSRYYGPYKYLDILDTLRVRGFNVISEVRPKNTDEVTYAKKIKSQVDSLLALGAAPGNIIIVGASLGAYITLESALLIKKSDIKFAVLGLCSDYAIEYFSKTKHRLSGNFLSIYERTDEKGSCKELFSHPTDQFVFKEIQINMGNGHSFLFQPHPEWVIPLVNWIRKSGS